MTKESMLDAIRVQEICK